MGSRMKRLIKRGAVVLVVLVILILSASWFLHRNKKSESSFRTVPVNRGDLFAMISATGTVEPEEVVDVGTQVAGRIVNFGKDQSGKPIDYGSVVEEGTVLAQIDDALYAADVAQIKAQLEQAKAGVIRAEADLGQMQAKLFQADRDWNRARKLGPSDALSQSDYDASQSAFEVAKANLAVGKAAIVQSKEAVAQAEANRRRAQQNLDYCTIHAPVKGVVIDRRVNIGQTVVSSLNAPSLFLLAKDLKRMQVWVSVNEADIGNIHPGQPVNFTVDAYPGQTFTGEVGKVRLNATMTQNVVNYTVEVITDNSSGKLLPYLTANVKFLVSSRQNVLYVPNAALRWTPQPQQIVQDSRNQPKAAPVAEGTPRPQPAAEGGQEEGARGVLWTPEGAFVRSIPVRIGLSDGAMTEVQGQDLREGTLIVLGEQAKPQASGPSSAASPFAPQFLGRGRPPAGSEGSAGGSSQQRH
jgi:HlyD family secretion protein